MTADKQIELKLRGDNNKYFLLQWPNDNIKIGETLIVRGELDEEAVICTRDQTYKIAEQCTSNTLLITNSDGSIIETASSSLEVTKTKPKIQKLKSILKQHVFEG